MRLLLTENTKKFIATLDETDLAKCTITEDVVESDDEGISNKLKDYIKARLKTAGDKIRAATAQFRIEHPEYFE